MGIIIENQLIAKKDLKSLAKEMYGNFVKAVVLEELDRYFLPYALAARKNV